MLKLGRLTQISERVKRFAEFRCDCGVEKKINYYDVSSGKTRSCGCLLKEWLENNINKDDPCFRVKNNRLTQVSRKENNRAKFLCTCGTVKEINCSSVATGKTKSCGCLNKEKRSANLRGSKGRLTHGDTLHPFWNTWHGMKYRCSSPNHIGYKDYGGRGISVCNEWKDSFLTFVDDMGDRPEGYTLDRKDTNKGYFKENCRWVDKRVQANNRRRVKSSSRYRGVSWSNSKCKWISRVFTSDKGKDICHFVGSFLSEKDAAKAYDQKVIDLGIDKQLNFKQSKENII